jgi:hypothetical protein
MYSYLKVEIRGPEESSFHEERISMLGSLARLSLLTINRVKSNPNAACCKQSTGSQQPIIIIVLFS